MNKSPTLLFNQVIDYTSLDTSEFTISPTPDGYDGTDSSTALGSYNGNEIWVAGMYQPNTTYTFTLKKGATVQDYYGAMYTNDADKTITWKTASKIVMSSTTADNTVIQKITTKQLVGVSLTFNANMDPTTIDNTEFSFVNKAGTDVTTMPFYRKGVGSGATGAICDPFGLSCQLRFRADLPPDDYTFTLKAGAKIDDISSTPNTFTNEKDVVIHITVKAPVEAAQCL
jgi:hypothetical protein